MVNCCFNTDFFLMFLLYCINMDEKSQIPKLFYVILFWRWSVCFLKTDRKPDVKNDFCWEILKALTSDPLSSHHSIVISRPYTVVLGADTLSGNETTKQEFRTIRSIPHPSYNGHANDIMLLKVLNCCLLHFVTFNSKNPSSLSLQLCRIT